MSSTGQAQRGTRRANVSPGFESDKRSDWDTRRCGTPIDAPVDTQNADALASLSLGNGQQYYDVYGDEQVNVRNDYSDLSKAERQRAWSNWLRSSERWSAKLGADWIKQRVL